MVPVRLGHPSRFPNRDQPIRTNAGPGSDTNRDQWGSTWPVLARRGGRLIGPGSCYEPGPMSAFFLYLGFRVSLSPMPPLAVPPLAGAPSPSRRCLRRLPLLRIADVLSISHSPALHLALNSMHGTTYSNEGTTITQHCHEYITHSSFVVLGRTY